VGAKVRAKARKYDEFDHRRLTFTYHAVDRYVQRHAPELTIAEATRRLAAAALGAVRLKERTVRGHDQYHLPDLDVIAVIKRDPGRKGATVVTILPAKAPAAERDAEVIESDDAVRAPKPVPRGRPLAHYAASFIISEEQLESLRAAGLAVCWRDEIDGCKI